MAVTNNRRIVSMNDTDLTPADPAEDVRGRTVVDVNGDDIGDIEDLMLDQDESKVRFLQVGAGGFLGIGERKFLIPVDAITSIDEDHVYIDRSRESIIAGPDYDPTLVRDDTNDIWANTYTYYGFAPYWAPGYVYPAYPFYGTVAPGRPDAPVYTDADAYGGDNLSETEIVHHNPDVGERDQRDTHD
jgi:sporulation protein YlmC with PRC-barrel domain